MFATPFLQANFLKALTLILNASGPSTLSLPALTTEFWALLLYMRPAALQAVPVLEALLLGFLTLLDINDNDKRQIATEHSTELLETRAWTEQVFETAAGGSQEGNKIKSLAAAVSIRTNEIVEEYQRLVMGKLSAFSRAINA